MTTTKPTTTTTVSSGTGVRVKEDGNRDTVRASERHIARAIVEKGMDTHRHNEDRPVPSVDRHGSLVTIEIHSPFVLSLRSVESVLDEHGYDDYEVKNLLSHHSGSVSVSLTYNGE